MSDETKKGRELTSDADVRQAMTSAKTLAVIGMKQRGAASYVPAFMEARDYRIFPVNPKFDELDGKACVDRVDQLDEAIDMVVVFRRSPAVVDHVDEILAMTPRPATVWMQLGIRNAEATRSLTDAGIDVVQSRCLKIEYPRLVRG